MISGALCDPKPEVRGGIATGEIEMNPVADLPDYFNDLNAMHEAEKVLDYKHWGTFAAVLYKITNAHNHGVSPNHHWLAVATATAAQRAEAFGKTLGLW